jgi:nucleoside 2-deoxyribosyltransferase
MDISPIVYIASPFFCEESQTWVGMKEEEFKGMKIPYFSPREDGINFHAVKNVNYRSERIKAIFKNNIRNLDKCEHICINLNPTKGKVDIGTLWEFGYFLGKHGDPHFDTDEYSTITGSGEVLALARYWIRNLKDKEVPDITGKSNKYFLTNSVNLEKVKASFELTDMNYEVRDINPTLDNIDQEFFTKKTILHTDDFPSHIFVLAGWMFSKKLPYYTASFRNFGSNVMMAASSKGHIQFPGVTDDTYREDLK